MNAEVTCSCCGRSLLWRLDTQLVGYRDDGEGGWLELRNCACGSTIAQPWAPEQAVAA
jgi:hypothetical protein